MLKKNIVTLLFINLNHNRVHKNTLKCTFSIIKPVNLNIGIPRYQINKKKVYIHSVYTLTCNLIKDNF